MNQQIGELFITPIFQLFYPLYYWSQNLEQYIWTMVSIILPLWCFANVFVLIFSKLIFFNFVDHSLTQEHHFIFVRSKFLLLFNVLSVSWLQNQPSVGVLIKICSEYMLHIYRRTTMPKWDFNKVVKQLFWNHTLGWVSSCKFAAHFTTCEVKLIDLLKVPSLVLLAGISQEQPPQIFYIIGVLKNFAKLIGKYLCQKRDSGTGVYLWIFQNF